MFARDRRCSARRRSDISTQREVACRYAQ